MNIPPPLPLSSRRSYSVPGWSIAATLIGLACFALPPYLLRETNSLPVAKAELANTHPLLLWFAFAFANLRVLPTMALFLVLGVVLGLAQPSRWLRMGGLAVSLPPVLHTINLIREWAIDPTSHNLFPFEYAFLAVVSLPAVIGAFLGSSVGRVIRIQTD